MNKGSVHEVIMFSLLFAGRVRLDESGSVNRVPGHLEGQLRSPRTKVFGFIRRFPSETAAGRASNHMDEGLRGQRLPRQDGPHRSSYCFRVHVCTFYYTTTSCLPTNQDLLPLKLMFHVHAVHLNYGVYERKLARRLDVAVKMEPSTKPHSFLLEITSYEKNAGPCFCFLKYLYSLNVVTSYLLFRKHIRVSASNIPAAGVGRILFALEQVERIRPARNGTRYGYIETNTRDLMEQCALANDCYALLFATALKFLKRAVRFYNHLVSGKLLMSAFNRPARSFLPATHSCHLADQSEVFIYF